MCFAEILQAVPGILNTGYWFSLLSPALNLSLLQTPTFWFVWPDYVSGTLTCIRIYNGDAFKGCTRFA